MNKTQQDLRLLPNKYKKVAYGFMLLSVLVPILSKVGVVTIEKEVTKTIFSSGILLSMLLLALTRDKLEDELTLKIRLKALAISFIYGVGYVIAGPFVNLLFDGEFLYEDMGMESLLLTMFLFYFMMFNLMKRNR